MALRVRVCSRSEVQAGLLRAFEVEGAHHPVLGGQGRRVRDGGLPAGTTIHADLAAAVKSIIK